MHYLNGAGLHCATPTCVVQHQFKLCTTNLRCAPWCTSRTYVCLALYLTTNKQIKVHNKVVHNKVVVVHNVASYRLGGAKDNSACSLSIFFDGVQCSVVSLSVCLSVWVCDSNVVHHLVGTGLLVTSLV